MRSSFGNGRPDDIFASSGQPACRGDRDKSAVTAVPFQKVQRASVSPPPFSHNAQVLPARSSSHSYHTDWPFKSTVNARAVTRIGVVNHSQHQAGVLTTIGGSNQWLTKGRGGGANEPARRPSPFVSGCRNVSPPLSPHIRTEVAFAPTRDQYAPPDLDAQTYRRGVGVFSPACQQPGWSSGAAGASSAKASAEPRSGARKCVPQRDRAQDQSPGPIRLDAWSAVQVSDIGSTQKQGVGLFSPQSDPNRQGSTIAGLHGSKSQPNLGHEASLASQEVAMRSDILKRGIPVSDSSKSPGRVSPSRAKGRVSPSRAKRQPQHTDVSPPPVQDSSLSQGSITNCFPYASRQSGDILAEFRSASSRTSPGPRRRSEVWTGATVETGAASHVPANLVYPQCWAELKAEDGTCTRAHTLSEVSTGASDRSWNGNGKAAEPSLASCSSSSKEFDSIVGPDTRGFPSAKGSVDLTENTELFENQLQAQSGPGESPGASSHDASNTSLTTIEECLSAAPIEVSQSFLLTPDNADPESVSLLSHNDSAELQESSSPVSLKPPLKPIVSPVVAASRQESGPMPYSDAGTLTPESDTSKGTAPTTTSHTPIPGGPEPAPFALVSKAVIPQSRIGAPPVPREYSPPTSPSPSPFRDRTRLGERVMPRVLGHRPQRQGPSPPRQPPQTDGRHVSPGRFASPSPPGLQNARHMPRYGSPGASPFLTVRATRSPLPPQADLAGLRRVTSRLRSKSPGRRDVVSTPKLSAGQTANHISSVMDVAAAALVAAQVTAAETQAAAASHDSNPLNAASRFSQMKSCGVPSRSTEQLIAGATLIGRTSPDPFANQKPEQRPECRMS